MFGDHDVRQAAGRPMHRYYKCHGKDTVARDRACRCTQTPAKVEELDAAVWGHVKALLEDPAALAARFEELARAVGGEGRRPRRGPAVGGPTPTARPRGAAAGRRLPGRGDRPGRVEGPPRTDPGPAAGPRRPSATRSSGCRPSVRRRRRSGRTSRRSAGGCGPGSTRRRLAERQRILQLLIERVIVGEDSLEIRHVIPLGRAGGEPSGPGPEEPSGPGDGKGRGPEETPGDRPNCRLRSDGVRPANLPRLRA